MSGAAAPIVIVHGGVGSPMQYIDGCHAAAQAALAELAAGAGALDAVVRAVVVMEDDGRFNAGSGAVKRLDGALVEMDAAVMDTRGRLGTVACIKGVRNPVLVARAVADSPHQMLCGEGAERFARLLGMAAAAPPGDQAQRQREATIAHMLAELSGDADAGGESFARLWNFTPDLAGAHHTSCDTVGAVARDAGGHFAVAGSSGGITTALLGRVGDTPLFGAGFYAGPAGAVAVTGIGERIVPHLLAHTVYTWFAEGGGLARALKRGVALFPAHHDIGIIAVSRTESAVASNRDLPSVTMSSDGGR